jgi:hypothetical protein
MASVLGAQTDIPPAKRIDAITSPMGEISSSGELYELPDNGSLSIPKRKNSLGERSGL